MLQDSVAGQGGTEALLSCAQSGGQHSQPRMAGLLERHGAEMLPGSGTSSPGSGAEEQPRDGYPDSIPMSN